MGTQTINENSVVVYNSISDDRFGGTESIRVWNYGDDITECKEYIKKTIDSWKKHFKEYLQKNDKEGMAFAQKCVTQYTKEFDTIRVIDISEFKNIQALLLLKEPQEISEDIYWEMLECLPPLKTTKNGFIMSEFYTGSYTRQFYKKNNKYYTKMIDYSNQDTWAV